LLLEPLQLVLAFHPLFIHLIIGIVSQSPKLLQLSGIGDSAILGPLGIKTRIDLKTVGRNLQEQVCFFPIHFISLFAEVFLIAQTINLLGADGNGFNPGGRGPSNAIAYPNIYQLFNSQADAMVHKIRSSLDAWAASQADYAISAAALRKIYEIQANLIIKENCEVEPKLRAVPPWTNLFPQHPSLSCSITKATLRKFT
jgi:choline dehydrogenase